MKTIPAWQKIFAAISNREPARVSDLHLWRLGPGHRGLIVSLVSPSETNAEAIKASLRQHHPGLSHVTIEVTVCADCGAP